jgi:hypothetical protein
MSLELLTQREQVETVFNYSHSSHLFTAVDENYTAKLFRAVSPGKKENEMTEFYRKVRVKFLSLQGMTERESFISFSSEKSMESNTFARTSARRYRIVDAEER